MLASLPQPVRRTETEIVECGTCRQCCKGEMIQLQPGDDPSLYVTEPSISPITGPGLRIPLKDGIRECHYLGPDGCTIYEKRPAICRTFSCVKMVKRFKDILPRQTIRRMLRDGQIEQETWDAGLERMK